MIGVCGETGDVLAIRTRADSVHPGRRATGGFIRERTAASAAAVRERSNLWV